MIGGTAARTLLILVGLVPLRAEAQILAPQEVMRLSGSVTIQYRLTESAQRVVIDIVDSRDRVVRQFASADTRTGATAGQIGMPAAGPPLAATSGLNQVTWDLRFLGALTLGTTTDGSPAYEVGPLASPGTYKIRLTVGSAPPNSIALTIKKDSQTTATDADLEAQAALAKDILADATLVAEVVAGVRGLKAQVAERLKTARSPVIGLAADVVSRRLGEVETALAVVPARPGGAAPSPESRLGARCVSLAREVMSKDERPSSDASERHRVLEAELDQEIRRFESILGNEIKAFNGLLTNATMDPLVLPALPERDQQR